MDGMDGMDGRWRRGCFKDPKVVVMVVVVAIVGLLILMPMSRMLAGRPKKTPLAATTL